MQAGEGERGRKGYMGTKDMQKDGQTDRQTIK